jgi:putative Ca2+/H+ antiporter (TMEM165/GDT1 family)
MPNAIDLRLFASTFALIFVAELPDKTALATVLLAIRYQPFAVFAGVAIAFMVQSVVAVTFGSAIGLLPREAVRITAGALFLVFAVLMWVRRRPAEEALDEDGDAVRAFWRTAWASFVVIFLAEWGDLTQLATAALAAEYRSPLTIFTAATLALWAVSAIAITVGHRIKGMVDEQVLQRIAAIAFGLVGAFLLVRP